MVPDSTTTAAVSNSRNTAPTARLSTARMTMLASVVMEPKDFSSTEKR